MSGVSPLWSVALILLPNSSRTLAHSTWLFSAALWRAVPPTDVCWANQACVWACRAENAGGVPPCRSACWPGCSEVHGSAPTSRRRRQTGAWPRAADNTRAASSSSRVMMVELSFRSFAMVSVFWRLMASRNLKL